MFKCLAAAENDPVSTTRTKVSITAKRSMKTLSKIMLCVYLGFSAQLPQESPIRTRNLPSRRGLSPVKRGEIRLCAVTVFRAQVHVAFSVRIGVSLRHDLLQEPRSVILVST